MAKVIEGNLVTALLVGDIDVAAHCCNCRNSFGAGIAKEFMERIPKSYQADTLTHGRIDNPEELLGGVSIGGKVVNLYGQLNYGSGKQVDYGAYSLALASMIDALSNLPNPDVVVGFPYKIASDRAGGDWEVIREITEGMMKCAEFEMVWYRL